MWVGYAQNADANRIVGLQGVNVSLAATDLLIPVVVPVMIKTAQPALGLGRRVIPVDCACLIFRAHLQVIGLLACGNESISSERVIIDFGLAHLRIDR